MMRTSSPATLIVSLMCVLVLHPVTSSAQIIDRVLASVGGRIVTASDVRMAREFGLVQVRGMTATDPQMILERLVNRMLVLDEVGRYAPPEPAERDVKERFDVLRARFETSDAFAAAMRLTGVDEATLMQWVRNDLRIRAYLDQRFAGVVEPSGADLENYVRQIRANAAKSGRTMEDDEVTRLAREQAVADRRQALIQEWIEGLRRRAAISYTQAEF
jgi:hypothetical protein